MTTHARGTFDVTMTPQPPDDNAADVPVGRMPLAKQFHGDLDATSAGQMLAVSTDVDGSARYVALERVTGTLQGRGGSFALQHNGTMTRGTLYLTVTVVPDSGAAHLVGLAGALTIAIVDGQHVYDFAYTLLCLEEPLCTVLQSSLALGGTIPRLAPVGHHLSLGVFCS